MGNRDPGRKTWLDLADGAWVGREKSRREVLNEKGFIESVSVRANVRPDTVSAILSALIVETVHQLRTRGIVRWPGLGDFYLCRKKDQVFRTAKQGVQFIPEHYVLRFKPFYRLQRYFSRFSRILTGKSVVKLKDGES